MLSHKINQLTGFDFARVVGGDTGGDLHLVAIDSGQHDDGCFELVFEFVHGLAQGLGVGAFQTCGQHFDTVDIDGLQHQLVTLRRGQLALQRGHFFFKRTHLIEHLANAVLQLDWAGFER